MILFEFQKLQITGLLLLTQHKQVKMLNSEYPQKSSRVIIEGKNFKKLILFFFQ